MSTDYHPGQGTTSSGIEGWGHSPRPESRTSGSLTEVELAAAAGTSPEEIGTANGEATIDGSGGDETDAGHTVDTDEELAGEHNSTPDTRKPAKRRRPKGIIAVAAGSGLAAASIVGALAAGLLDNKGGAEEGNIRPPAAGALADPAQAEVGAVEPSRDTIAETSATPVPNVTENQPKTSILEQEMHEEDVQTVLASWEKDYDSMNWIFYESDAQTPLINSRTSVANNFQERLDELLQSEASANMQVETSHIDGIPLLLEKNGRVWREEKPIVYGIRYEEVGTIFKPNPDASGEQYSGMYALIYRDPETGKFEAVRFEEGAFFLDEQDPIRLVGAFRDINNPTPAIIKGFIRKDGLRDNGDIVIDMEGTPLDHSIPGEPKTFSSVEEALREYGVGHGLTPIGVDGQSAWEDLKAATLSLK